MKIYTTVDDQEGDPISWAFGIFKENITSHAYLQEDPMTGNYQFLVHFDATGPASGSGDVPLALSGNVYPPITEKPPALPDLSITYSVTGWTPPTAANPTLSCNLSVSLEWNGTGGHQGPSSMFSDRKFSGPVTAEQLTKIKTGMKKTFDFIIAIEKATGVKW